MRMRGIFSYLCNIHCEILKLISPLKYICFCFLSWLLNNVGQIHWNELLIVVKKLASLWRKIMSFEVFQICELNLLGLFMPYNWGGKVRESRKIPLVIGAKKVRTSFMFNYFHCASNLDYFGLKYNFQANAACTSWLHAVIRLATHTDKLNSHCIFYTAVELHDQLQTVIISLSKLLSVITAAVV